METYTYHYPTHTPKTYVQNKWKHIFTQRLKHYYSEEPLFNSQNLEKTKISINRRVDIHIVVWSYNVRAPLIAQLVKNLPAMPEILV